MSLLQWKYAGMVEKEDDKMRFNQMKKEIRICSLCMSYNLAFQRHLGNMQICLQKEDAKYQEKINNQFVFYGNSLNARKCNYNLNPDGEI